MKPTLRILAIAVAATIAPLSLLGPAAAQDSYHRLGGYDAIAAVTDDFLGRLEDDERLGRFFSGLSTDSKTKVRQHVVDLVCASTGGPCAYTGRDMKRAHAGIGITKEDWDRSGQLFGETLAKFNVPEQERAEIGAIIAPLEKDIVDGGS